MGIKGETIPIPKDAANIDENRVMNAGFSIVSKKSVFSCAQICANTAGR